MNSVVTGLQWGDEGKGKIVDFLTESADFVVRGQGGNNAGHTVIAKGVKYVLHLLPSGILWEGKICVIGNGVVMDPVGLVKEIDDLQEKGISVPPERLLISDRAHVVLPYHRELDAAREASLGDRKIGTTKRGIGPAYADKANRCGLRLAVLLNKELAAELIELRLAEANPILASYDLPQFNTADVLASVKEALERLRPHITNTIPILSEAYKAGKEILFEGAQGAYLDVDFGTYPFVTSSNTTAGGASTGSGLPPHAINRVIGVCKAYTTRVGEGPFVTQNEDISNYLHGLGREFGATTGRARRCGWLDTVLLRFACMVNGVTDLAVTNLDGLDERFQERYTPEQFQSQLASRKQRWVEAIQKDKLSWEYHVSDLKYWSSAPAQVYGVNSIPRAFIIDRDGKIAHTNVRGAAAIEQAIQGLL